MSGGIFKRLLRKLGQLSQDAALCGLGDLAGKDGGLSLKV